MRVLIVIMFTASVPMAVVSSVCDWGSFVCAACSHWCLRAFRSPPIIERHRQQSSFTVTSFTRPPSPTCFPLRCFCTGLLYDAVRIGGLVVRRAIKAAAVAIMHHGLQPAPHSSPSTGFLPPSAESGLSTASASTPASTAISPQSHGNALTAAPSPYQNSASLMPTAPAAAASAAGGATASESALLAAIASYGASPVGALLRDCVIASYSMNPSQSASSSNVHAGASHLHYGGEGGAVNSSSGAPTALPLHPMHLRLLSTGALSGAGPSGLQFGSPGSPYRTTGSSTGGAFGEGHTPSTGPGISTAAAGAPVSSVGDAVASVEALLAEFSRLSAEAAAASAAAAAAAASEPAPPRPTSTGLAAVVGVAVAALSSASRRSSSASRRGSAYVGQVR